MITIRTDVGQAAQSQRVRVRSDPRCPAGPLQRDHYSLSLRCPCGARFERQSTSVRTAHCFLISAALAPCRLCRPPTVVDTVPGPPCSARLNGVEVDLPMIGNHTGPREAIRQSRRPIGEIALQIRVDEHAAYRALDGQWILGIDREQRLAGIIEDWVIG